eukprot:363618-Chlamydomonas_euryale.AAC.15
MRVHALACMPASLHPVLSVCPRTCSHARMHTWMHDTLSTLPTCMDPCRSACSATSASASPLTCMHAWPPEHVPRPSPACMLGHLSMCLAPRLHACSAT